MSEERTHTGRVNRTWKEVVRSEAKLARILQWNNQDLNRHQTQITNLQRRVAMLEARLDYIQSKAETVTLTEKAKTALSQPVVFITEHTTRNRGEWAKQVKGVLASLLHAWDEGDIYAFLDENNGALKDLLT